jgi:hypothetical protein
MKENKLTFSKLPYVGGNVHLSSEAALAQADVYRRDKNLIARTFTRTVKAGGAEYACYVTVARRRAE